MSTLRELQGDKVAARDGVAGSLRDVYFDEQHWAVRYVEPGLSGPARYASR